MLSFDSTTLAAYRAASTPQGKAQAVSDQLGSGTLTVELRDGATLMYSGDFAGPLVVGSDGSLSKDVVPAGLAIVAGTASAATWTCKLRNSAGTRTITGPIGAGSGHFTLASPLVVGQGCRLNISIAPAQAPLPVYGLIYPSNGESGGNIGLDWTGANMVPFYSHTVLWKANYVQQTGYYATSWHCPVNGEFTGGAHSNSGADFIGGHPYPCDGTVDGYGQAQNYGSSFITHYHELVPWGGSDYLASAGESALAVTKGVWYWQARTAELISGGTVARFRFWPDVENNPSFVIEQTKPLSELIQSGNALMFRHGCSPWTASGSTNSECLSGTIRHLLQYGRALTAAELPAKFSRTTDDTSDPDIWYSNLNPKPDDVADKSGQGHHPAFANANLPTLYTG
jgi:hypothetical protein